MLEPTGDRHHLPLLTPRKLVTKLPCAFSLAILVPSFWNGARSLHLTTTCASDTTASEKCPLGSCSSKSVSSCELQNKICFSTSHSHILPSNVLSNRTSDTEWWSCKNRTLTIVTCYDCTVHAWVVMLQAVPLHSLLCKRAHDTHHHTRQ